MCIRDRGDVVYVQTGGERFARRLVRTGLRDGDYVAIIEGLAPGERVVSRGAYRVHLALSLIHISEPTRPY